MLGTEAYQRYVERGIIEIAPLAYMRGRTLDDAFIILDEAQNTTPEQMKMFLTRLGNNSKAIITGDITQIDLPFIRKSGLVDALEILDNIKGIGPIKRNALLAHFNSIEDIKRASQDELMTVEGITKQNAEAIKEYFC
jgi:phosphate starvation-inducible PhoH-like protein